MASDAHRWRLKVAGGSLRGRDVHVGHFHRLHQLIISTIDYMDALDELTLRRRRDRLLNPIMAPHVELQEQLFGPFVPPPPIPPPPATPVPPVGMVAPPALSTPVAETPDVKPSPGKSREERQEGRLERRGYYSGHSLRERLRLPEGLSPKSKGSSSSDSVRLVPPAESSRQPIASQGFPSFNISPSNLLSPLVARSRAKVKPFNAAS